MTPADFRDHADSLESNVFHIAEDCLTEPSKFALSHDTVVDVLGLDAPRVSEGSGTTVAMEAGNGDAGGGGGDADSRPAPDEGFTEADGEEFVAELADSAWELAAAAESLVHLDELVAEHEAEVFPGGAVGNGDASGGSGGDGRDEPYEVVTADPDDPDPAAAAGAYLGEVFVRTYDAEWTAVDDGGWVVEVNDYEGNGDEETAVVAVPAVLRDCIAGEATFAMVHDAAVEDLGLAGPTLTDGDTE